jgi:hypothetical protein
MPEPMGAAQGMSTSQPASASRWQVTRSSVQHREAVMDQLTRGFDQLEGVGLQGLLVAHYF